MTDRRRINGPAGGTSAPIYDTTLSSSDKLQSQRPTRKRAPDEPRKIFLKTGITPSASGSAYYELQADPGDKSSLVPSSSTLKISCTVHGPRPLPRSAPFSPNLVLNTNVKFAPFATRLRRGYVRDATERDLAVHLESALRGVVIAERWPKSGVDVIITVLEGEEDGWWGDEMAVDGSAGPAQGGWGMMGVLAGCITVASAAIAEAGIDCVDLVSGGVAALVREGGTASVESDVDTDTFPVLDPCPPEHREIVAACVVGYLARRDEVTEVWMKGNIGSQAEQLMDKAVQAAVATRTVLSAAVEEAAKAKAYYDES